jgi:hypothetical protein
MTIAELTRAIESKERQEKERLKEKAIFDYNLADLIGRSISRIYSSSAKMPEIATIYPSLFDSEEIKQQKQVRLNELSVARFKQFADTFNKHKQEVAKGNNE